MDEAATIDDTFLRRYRELLDNEDEAFDALDHAFEDGDRRTFEDHLNPGGAAPRGAPPRLLRPARLRLRARPLVLSSPAQLGGGDGRGDDVARSTTCSVRPTKKWLAPPITATSVARHAATAAVTSSGVGGTRRARETSDLGSRAGPDGVRIGEEPQRRRDREPRRNPRVEHRERDVGAERPAGQDERHRPAGLLGERRDRRHDIELLAPSLVVGAPARLDAPEVEAQAGHARAMATQANRALMTIERIVPP